MRRQASATQGFSTKRRQGEVMTTETAASGGCLCGDVRYGVQLAQARTLVCHCRNCQKQSGSAFSILLVVPKDQLEITGALATYEDRGASGEAVARKFCPRCGSAVISEPASLPGIAAIKAGTLDDITGLAPQVHIWCSSAQPWFKLPSDLPCLPRQ